MFKLFKIINLPIPYPMTDEKRGWVEIEDIDFSLLKAKLMMLTLEEAWMNMQNKYTGSLSIKKSNLCEQYP